MVFLGFGLGRCCRGGATLEYVAQPETSVAGEVSGDSRTYSGCIGSRRWTSATVMTFIISETGFMNDDESAKARAEVVRCGGLSKRIV